MDSPFDTFEVYSKNYRRQQEVDVFSSCTLQPRFNGQGTGEFAVPLDAPVLQYLQQDGARIIARYRGEHLMSGAILDPQGEWRPDGSVRFQIEDDWRILTNSLAWPRPRGNLRPNSGLDLGQAWQVSPAGDAFTVTGQRGYFQWPAEISSAEGAIKHLVSENIVTRLGRPVVIGANRDRGGNARAAGLLTDAATVRFDQVDEAIEPLLTFSGLHLRVWQEPGETFLRLDTFETKRWPQQLTLSSGILTEGEWSTKRATATRVIIGGPGEDAARVFYEQRDTALEARYNDVIEIFKDSTNAPLEWPEGIPENLRNAKYAHLRNDLSAEARRALLAALTAAATKALADSAESVGLNVKLAETDSFHFHGIDGIHIGDEVDVARLNDDQSEAPFRDRITTAAITVGDSGLQINPQLGGIVDDEDDELWDYMTGLATVVRRNQTKR